MDLDALLARARHLEVKSRFLARSHYAGLYRSAFRGQGMEFADVRAYSDGDDVRLIDWNVSARSQSLYVKRMEEERERNVLVLIDASGSMRFGSSGQSKFELLTELAALFVIAGFHARDRLSLAAFSSTVDPYVPAGKGWNHAARLIREIVSATPAGHPTDLESVWNFLNSPGIPRSLVLMLTDFQAPLQASNSFGAASRKHEIVAIVITDPREWELPPVGRVRIHDPETRMSRLVDTRASAARAGYQEAGRQKREKVRAVFEGGGVDWIEISTAESYEGRLRKFLELRSARRGCRRQ